MNVLTVKFLVKNTKNFTIRTFIFIFLNSGQNNFFLIFQKQKTKHNIQWLIRGLLAPSPQPQPSTLRDVCVYNHPAGLPNQLSCCWMSVSCHTSGRHARVIANTLDADSLSSMATTSSNTVLRVSVGLRSLNECCTEYCPLTSIVARDTKWADVHLGGGLNCVWAQAWLRP